MKEPSPRRRLWGEQVLISQVGSHLGSVELVPAEILGVRRGATEMQARGCQQVASEVGGNRYGDNEHDDRNRAGGVTSPPTGLGMNRRRGNRLSVRKSIRAYGPCPSPSDRPVCEDGPYGVQAVGRHPMLPIPVSPGGSLLSSETSQRDEENTIPKVEYSFPQHSRTDILRTAA